MENLRDTEIEDFRRAILTNNYVLRLDVAVEEMLGVGILHCIEDRLENWSDTVFDYKSGYSLYIFIERNSGSIFHHQIHIPLFIHMIVDKVDNIGVVERCKVFSLRLEKPHGKRVEHLFVYHFYRHLLSGNIFVFGKVNTTHSAFSDKCGNPIIQNLFAYHSFFLITFLKLLLLSI